MKDAQNNKPKIQKLGDKISSYFVPVVVFISIITFLLSYFVFNIEIVDSLLRSIAVLVISCPCVWDWLHLQPYYCRYRKSS